MKFKRIFILLLSVFAVTSGFAQQYPVQVNLQLIPPYTVYLSDFASSDFGDKLRLNILLKDMQQEELQVRLRFTIEGLNNNVVIQTDDNFAPSPIFLNSGVPTILTGADISEYFNPQNMIFSGLDVNEFATTSKMPEGLYRFTVQVLELTRNAVVSNTAMATAWMMLNEPPVWVMPVDNQLLTPMNPQSIVFTWMPMHSGSPNSAFSTEYEFTIVEVPEGVTPYEAIEQNNPVFFYQYITQNPTLVYDMNFPPLELGKRYACRVRAYDVNGLDVFRNNGYSSVISFVYGQECLTPLSVEVLDVHRHDAELTWQARPGNVKWQIFYRYFSTDTTCTRWRSVYAQSTDYTLEELRAQKTYQFKIKALCPGGSSDFTYVYEFTTDSAEYVPCNEGVELPEITNTTLIDSLSVGDTIQISTYSVKLLEVSKNNNSYSGEGNILNSPFRVRLHGEFSNLKVNTDYRVFEGNINIVQSDSLLIN